MKRTWIVGAAVVIASTFAALPDKAEAQGLHFSAGRFHVDVGNPHYGSWYSGGRRGHYSNYNGHYRAYRGGPPRHHGHWHDTSHFDYHPGGYVRHGNHFDYMPGHYDYHETGHWHHGH